MSKKEYFVNQYKPYLLDYAPMLILKERILILSVEVFVMIEPH